MKPYYDHAGIQIYNGHVLDVLKGLPEESVNCVVTSPPYWGLRDYGLEPQIWDDLGDCEHEWGDDLIHKKTRYDLGTSTQSGTNKDQMACNTYEHHHQFCLKCNAWKGSLGLEPTPELYIQHMVQVFREVRRVMRKDGTCWLNLGDSYAAQGISGRDIGYNERTGRGKIIRQNRYKILPPNLKPKDLCMIPARVALALQADGWWLRSDIVWAKPNPMPESVTDRPTRSHECIFLLTKDKRYFYDAEAIKEPNSPDGRKVKEFRGSKKYANGFGPNKASMTPLRKHERWPEGGRNKRSVWTIATQPFPEAHFATFPEEIPRICILAGCPEGGTVLDPFSGSGKTLIVAKKLRRKAIGIELNQEYAEMGVKYLSQDVFNFGDNT